MTKLALYPGTFDPLTLGHYDLIERASGIFDTVVVAVSRVSTKNCLFDVDERVEMALHVVAPLGNVEVRFFDGLLVEYARSIGCRVIVRGLRAYSDFEYEFQMALTNRKLAPEIETLFMMPKESYSYVSSSTVREVARLGGDTHEFVPPEVQAFIDRKFSVERKQHGA